MLESSTPPPVDDLSGAAVSVARIARTGRPVSACSYVLETTTGPTGPILLLHVAGEIDICTLPGLQHALAAAIDERPTGLVVDLAAVTFCCVRGYDTLLADAAVAAQTSGISYAVSGCHPYLHHIAAQLPVWQRCVHYRSAAAAVSAIRVEQAGHPT